MEIEEMKTLWQEMSLDMDKQKKLTDSIIIKMTKADYRNKINKIQIPETLGSLVCLLDLVFIGINFEKLNTWYLVVCGMISMLILFLLPLLSIRTIYGLQSVNITDNNYKQSLLDYSRSSLRFVQVQKLSFYLGAILLLVILPVMGRLFAGKDFFIETRLWIWYAIGFPFFYLFSRWVFKSYMKSTADAEKLLKEMAN